MENQYMLILPKNDILDDSFVSDLLSKKGYVLQERKFLETKQIEEDCYYANEQTIDSNVSKIILSRTYYPPKIEVPFTDFEYFTILGHLKVKYKIEIEKNFWTLVFSAEVALKFLSEFHYKSSSTNLKPLFQPEPKTILLEVSHG